MNTKNGKCGVFAALTAALLVTAALITSCPAPEVVTVYKDGYQPPEGMGYIRINLPEFSGQRTVLPSVGAWTSYDLVITEYKGGVAQTPLATKNVLDGALGTPIPLSPGDYELTVTAKIGTVAGAQGTTSSHFQITAGTGTSVYVTIKPLPYTETTDGTFDYTVAFTGITGATATIAIKALVSGDAAYDGTPTPVTAGAHSIDLKPGSYSVFLEATVVGGLTQTASITEIVNIHQALTSSVGFEFNGTYFLAYINGVIVTYNKGDDIKPVLEDSSSDPINEGDTITLSGTNSETITITNAVSAEYDSITWYGGGGFGDATSGTFTITAGTAPFDKQIIYPVTVVGIINGVGAYSTSFKVHIVD